MYVPTKIPETDSVVNIIRKSHSICRKAKSELNPIIELNVMIINEVATACFIVNRANNTNAGTIIKPPPAPTKPLEVQHPNQLKLIGRNLHYGLNLVHYLILFFSS